LASLGKKKITTTETAHKDLGRRGVSAKSKARPACHSIRDGISTSEQASEKGMHVREQEWRDAGERGGTEAGPFLVDILTINKKFIRPSKGESN